MTFSNGDSFPIVGFGTWDVRGASGERVLLDALDAGYRLLDTAHMYGNERVVGKALRYLLQLGIAVVPKSSHRLRMEENLDAFDFELDAESMARIAGLDEGRSLFGWY